MDNITLMEYWINSSDRDYESMKKNFEIKQYTWALFIGHLTIEKLLKGLYAKNNTDNPYTIKSHNLLALAQKCNIELTDEQVQKLKIITQFNISARYEDYKNEFYDLCTEEYTTEQINNIEEVREIMESIEKYIERISQYYKIEAIILFGSYAKGTENEDSDIDIAVISSDFKNIIQDGADLIGYTWKIDTRIEPHPIRTEDYENIATPFVQEVINTGIKVA